MVLGVTLMGSVLSFFRPAPVAQGDWSQQELAEFYRVEAALTQAGLRVASDRGLADEGDPWFVFCRIDGEMIMHFARIDGLYVVASEVFEAPLWGSEFRALLDTVAAQHPTLVPIPRPSAQVSSSGTGGKLILHPAALLAAIVATAAFQLAGGDAVAGELATSDPTAPGGIAAGAADVNGAIGATVSHLTGIELETQARSTTVPEDEGRHARQAMILSAMALASEVLVHEHGEQASQVERADAAMAAHDTAAVTSAEERTALAHDTASMRAREHDSRAPIDDALGAQNQTTSSGVRPNLGIFNPYTPGAAAAASLTIVNAVEFGSAGAHEGVAFPLLGNGTVGFLLAHGLGAASGGLAAAADRATTLSGSAAETSAQSVAAAAASSVSSPASLGQRAPASSSPDASASGATSTGATSATAATPSPAPVASTPPSTSTNAGTHSVSAAGDADHALSASIPTAPANLAQTSVSLNMTVTAALSGLITQSALAASVAVGATIASLPLTGASTSNDAWLTSWAKTIGSSATTDALARLLSHTDGSVSDALASTPSTPGASSLPGLGASMGGNAVGGASVAITIVASHSTDATSVGTTLASTGAHSSSGPTNDAIASSAAGLAGSATQASIATGVVPASTAQASAAGGVMTAHASDGTTLADAAGGTSPTVAGTTASGHALDASLPLTTDTFGSIGVSGRATAGAGHAETGTSVGAMATTTANPAGHVFDGVAINGTASFATSLAGGNGHATTGTSPAGDGSAHTLVPADITLVSGASTSPGSPRPDTTPLSSSTPLASTTIDTTALPTSNSTVAQVNVPLLDDHGMQLINDFLHMTPNVQTIITEYSFVLVDGDRSHYANADFTIRTWHTATNVEVSIVGLVSDAYLAQHTITL